MRRLLIGLRLGSSRIAACACLALALPLSARLAVGPMTAFVEWNEAALWLQTESDAQVFVEWAPTEGGPGGISAPVFTTPKDHFTATLPLDGLTPGTAYRYTVRINGEAGPAGAFRTPPARSDFTAPPTFTLAVGGGLDPNGDGTLFRALAEAAPEAMLWLGDALPLDPADYLTATGYQRRTERARAAPGLAPLLARTAHYGVLGPTDFGPPRASRHWSHRATAVEAFTAAWPAPAYAFPGEATTHQFRWGDVDVFVLDAFSFRDSVTVPPRRRAILGERQLDWLMDALATSTATFKIVACGMPLLHPTEAADTFTSYKEEERAFLSALARVQPSGLLFLAGGRPMGEVSRVIRPDGYPLYEVLSGTLNRPAWTRAEYDDVNYFRLPGTLTLEPHFVLLTFSGSTDSRQVRLSARNAEGRELWAETLRASALRAAE